MCVCLESSLPFFFFCAFTDNRNLFYIAGGRDSSLFPDPLKFDPERWKRDDTHVFVLQPFVFGLRSCYGTRPGHFTIEISTCLL